MSGPKVVRIVTREEIVEICHGLLARVDAALAEWIRVGRRNECVDDEAIVLMQRRRAALAELIAVDRFTDVQKQAPIEEAFIRDDLQARLAKRAAEQAAARSRGRREREAAASLLRTLQSGAATIDPDLEARLQRGDADAISEGFRILTKRFSTASASRELASRLREKHAPASFAAWLASRSSADADSALETLELRIAELTPLVPEPTANAWRNRLNEAATAERARRGLLLDGLEVETGRVLADARQRASAATDLNLVLAELEAAGLATTALRSGIDALDSSALTARAAAARASLDAHRTVTAAGARRAVLLKGLAALGYDVTEGMSTTWAADGRLVLKSATRPAYGVEVSAAGGGERMQMRAVAFDADGSGPDPARDRDAETIWCGDLSTLQEGLSKLGGGLVIEKALPVGATPLKRIAVKMDRRTSVQVSTPRERTLR